MNIFSLTSQLNRQIPSLGRIVLGRIIPRIIPLTTGLGMRVLEMSGSRAELSLPLHRRTRNHVGSVYFGAQVTLAEITMGLLLFNRYPPGPYGVLVRKAEFSFEAKAKSELRAVCEPDPGLFQQVDRDMAASGKAEAWVDVRLLDIQGAVVTTCRFLAAFKDFSK